MRTDSYNTYLFKKTTYRFYGKGKWEILEKGEKIADERWLPINGIQIPAEVIQEAAKDCFPDGELGPL